MYGNYNGVHENYEQDQAQVHYGALHAPPQKPKLAKRKLNLKAAFLCWLIPSVTFALISAVWSTSIRTDLPILGTIVTLVLIIGNTIVFYLTSIMVVRHLAGNFPEFPFWYAFLAACSVLAVVSSFWFGNLNFKNNLEAYDTLDSLAAASGVDPAVDSSARFMDIGRVNFVNGTKLDMDKWIGFKNEDVYCVAPIVHKSTDKKLRAAQNVVYDFWAIGLNCCSGGNFKCGQYDNPKARSGVRLLRQDQRSFYNLAVQEAEVTYGIRTVHPLFFIWVEDAKELQNHWHDLAYQYWALGSITFAAFMCGFTVAAITVYAKLFLD